MLAFLRQKYRNLSSDARFSEIFTGSVWALSGRVVSTAFALAFSVLVARFYGAEEVGIVAIVRSCLMLLTIFTVLGTDTSILRLVPEYLVKYSPTSAFKVYRKTQWMVISVSIIITMILYFSADFIADKVFSKPHLAYYLKIAAFFVVFRSVMQLNTQAVRGLKLIKLFTVMQFMPQAGNLLFLLSVGFILPSRDVPVYALLFGFTATAITGWFAMELAFKKRMGADDIVRPMPARDILSISVPMLMSTSMMFLMSQTSILVLSMFRTEREVGYYSIAVQLANLSVFVLQAVNSMAAPKFSEYFHAKRMDDLFHVARKSAKLIFFITAPILLSLAVFGKLIISIVFGPNFLAAYTALLFLVTGQFIKSILGSTEIFMNMTGHEKALRNILIAAAGINVILNLLFIPMLGVNGAALATMLSVSFWNIMLLLYTKIYFQRTVAYLPFVI